MIPFAAYTAAGTPNAIRKKLSKTKKKQNCPFPGESQPHLMFSWAPRVSLQTASRSVRPFLHDSPVYRTDRQTYRRVDICRNRPHLCNACMRPKNGQRSKTHWTKTYV